MKIFISYNSEVNQFVAKLKKRLEEQIVVEQVFIFQCPEENPAGVVWTENLARNINDCDAFIAVITQKYLDSKICYKEITFADKKEKDIIPILFEDHKLNYEESSYGGSIEMIVTTPLNYIRFETTEVENSEYQRLIQGLRKVYARARPRDSSGSESGPAAKISKVSVAGATITTSNKGSASLPDPSVLKKVPSHFDLIYILADIDSKWQEIGLALGIETNVLEKISKRSQYSEEVKLSQVITEWKTSMYSPVTWATLISVIEGPILHNKYKADKIREYLAKGQ